MEPGITVAQQGLSARELLRDDREWVVCYRCRKKHPLRGNCADADYLDFHARHQPSQGCIVARVGPVAMEEMVRRAERRKRRLRHAVADFLHNASVLEAWGSLNLMSIANFGLSNSATAGWSSQWVQNVSSPLYLDYQLDLNITTWTGTPANNDALYFFIVGRNALVVTISSASVTAGAVYSNNGVNFTVLTTISSATTLYMQGNGVPQASGTLTQVSGTGPTTITFSSWTPVLPKNTAGNTVSSSSTSDATLTFLTIASNPTGFYPIKVIPYQASGDITNPGPFGCAQAYNGNLPQYLWWAAINYSGQTCTPAFITTQGIYNTVA